MSKAHPPELKNKDVTLHKLRRALDSSELTTYRYMEKRLALKLNGNRRVTGILRGFDPFMNLVIDETIEETKTGEKHAIGMVVIRGNSIIILEALDRV